MRYNIAMEPSIIDRGRGPEIAGTRITVFDILEYATSGWHQAEIAVQLRLSTEQVLAALRYIEEHKDSLIPEYQEMVARDARGNPAELQAKLDRQHALFLEQVRALQSKNGQENGNAGASGRR
jgi:uncharacterized protein (DUF433 family)